ncbi:hypothetical protein NEAUS06_2339 [Nematocida ausubeli]|nr:hypothetical protein NEAUS06_2339 [Nematocida ausubeli]
MINKLILNLMMVQSIIARVSMEAIKKVNEIPIGETKDVFINPEGPLCLLRGYIGDRSGHMYNKRFYSPEIHTDYALTKKGISDANEQEYQFERNPVKDRVYKDIATQAPNGEYLSTYHAQMIKMFPSVDGNLSIEAGRPTAITNFLRADHVKEDAKYILAALLLLSEGVDIKIAVDHTGNKKKLLINSKTVEGKVFANIELYMAGIDPAKDEYKENIPQNETAEIVNFYLRCRDKKYLRKGGDFGMPANKEEFESGKFLNNAGFLIQTYIYEFIDTVEAYTSLANAVHELLVDQMTDKGNPDENTNKKDKKGRIFSEFFLKKEAFDESKKYITSFYDLVKATNEDAKLPFYSVSQLPQYTRVPSLKLDKSGFNLDQASRYSDCVETGLLGLFCCLAYNPDARRYETSHMGDKISKELKAFFKKYPEPTETVDFKMHMEWARVVAGLESDKIDYKREKNELRSGLMNILLVIAEITGEEESIMELIQYIEECTPGNLSSEATIAVTDMMEEIITRLSYNKDLSVECDRVVLGKRTGGKDDILCEIRIAYIFDDAECGINLYIDKGHTTLNLFQVEVEESFDVSEKYEEVIDIFGKMNSYIGYIATRYANTELSNSGKSTETIFSEQKDAIQKIIKTSGFSQIPRIFLTQRITDSCCKEHIMDKFILYSIKQEISENDPATRFTANILGSVPLDDGRTMERLVKMFFYSANWQTYYPSLGFKPSENLPKKKYFITDMGFAYKSILKEKSVDLAVNSVINYITMDTDKEFDICDVLTKENIFISLFGLLQDKQEIEALKRFKSAFEKYRDSNNSESIDNLYISWFIYTCSNYRNNLNFIQVVYNLMNFDGLNPDNEKPSAWFTDRSFALDTLKEKKALLCSETDKESMKNYNKAVDFFTPTY